MAAIGYARVSTTAQDLALQLDALRLAGCERIFEDRGASGARSSRPGLDELLRFVRKGDTVVVWRLDRLGRASGHLATLVEELGSRGIGFCSLTEAIDTTSSGGRFIFSIFAGLAQLERDVIRERTAAGLAAAAARGRKGGRPRVMTPAKLDEARKLQATGHLTGTEIATRLKVSRSTLYAALYPNPHARASTLADPSARRRQPDHSPIPDA